MSLYELAIRSARGSGFVHYEAIAYERASASYRARKFDELADFYLRNACDRYMRRLASRNGHRIVARCIEISGCRPQCSKSFAYPMHLAWVTMATRLRWLD